MDRARVTSKRPGRLSKRAPSDGQLISSGLIRVCPGRARADSRARLIPPLRVIASKHCEQPLPIESSDAWCVCVCALGRWLEEKFSGCAFRIICYWAPIFHSVFASKSKMFFLFISCYNVMVFSIVLDAEFSVTSCLFEQQYIACDDAITGRDIFCFSEGIENYLNTFITIVTCTVYVIG